MPNLVAKLHESIYKMSQWRWGQPYNRKGFSPMPMRLQRATRTVAAVRIQQRSITPQAQVHNPTTRGMLVSVPDMRQWRNGHAGEGRTQRAHITVRTSITLRSEARLLKTNGCEEKGKNNVHRIYTGKWGYR